MGISAAEGAIAGGIGAEVSGLQAAKGATFAVKFGLTLARGEITGLSAEGLEYAFGITKHFKWSDVVATAASAAVQSSTAYGFGDVSTRSFTQSLFASAFNAVGSAMIGRAVYGEDIDVGMIAADSLGTAVGEYVGTKVTETKIAQDAKTKLDSWFASKKPAQPSIRSTSGSQLPKTAANDDSYGNPLTDHDGVCSWNGQDPLSDSSDPSQSDSSSQTPTSKRVTQSQRTQNKADQWNAQRGQSVWQRASGAFWRGVDDLDSFATGFDQGTIDGVKGAAQTVFNFADGKDALTAANYMTRLFSGSAPSLMQSVDAERTTLQGDYRSFMSSSELTKFNLAGQFFGGVTVAAVGGEVLGAVGGLRISAVGAEELPLFKTGGLSAEEANMPFVAASKRPPYATDTRARIIQLQRERVLVRVHGDGNQPRSWMMRPKEIEGLTPKQIKDKFALPDLPTHVSEVHLPSGSYLQVGTTAPQIGWGGGGAIQYQSLQRVDEDWFDNKQLLEAYLRQTSNIGMRL